MFYMIEKTVARFTIEFADTVYAGLLFRSTFFSIEVTMGKTSSSLETHLVDTALLIYGLLVVDSALY